MTMPGFIHGRDLVCVRWADDGATEYVLQRVSLPRAAYYQVKFFATEWRGVCAAMIAAYGWRKGPARIWDMVKMSCGWMDASDCKWLAFSFGAETRMDGIEMERS